MLYQYRWWAAGLLLSLIIFLGYAVDWGDAISQWRTLSALEQQQQLTLQALQQTLSREKSRMATASITTKSELKRLDVLIAAAQRQHLDVQSVRLKEMQSIGAANDWSFYVAVTGQFIPLTQFLLELYHAPAITVINDFSYQREEDGKMTLMLEVTLIGQSRSTIKTVAQPVVGEDPFCSAEHTIRFSRDNAKNVLTAVPLAQIQMLGYVQRGQRTQALIALPGQRVMAVEEGFLLGQERGVIQSIQQDRMMIRLGSQKIITIKIQ